MCSAASCRDHNQKERRRRKGKTDPADVEDELRHRAARSSSAPPAQRKAFAVADHKRRIKPAPNWNHSQD
jgi:hypothetical protein